MSRPEAQAERAPPEQQQEEEESRFEHERNITFREPKGAHTRYSLSKENLDVLLDAVRRMPDPGKFIQPLGWLILGVAATAGVEAYNANPNTSHRHTFVVVAVFAAISGLICLFADRKVKKEGYKHAEWCEEYLLRLYGAFGLEPPPKKLTWWQRSQLESKQKEQARVQAEPKKATPP